MTKDPKDYDYAVLRANALAYGMAHGIWDRDIAEDFAQEYCLQVWRGKHTSLSKQLVNFLRGYYGRTGEYGSSHSNAKSEALRSMKSYGEDQWIKPRPRRR